MTENVTGYGTSLAYGAATGASLPAYGADTYTTIPDLEEITPPSGSRQVEEYFVLDQKASKKLVGSISYDAAQGSATRAFDSAAQDQMEDDANAAVAVRRNWRISMPNAGAEVRYFKGYMSKFTFAGINNQGRIQYNWEITVDGDVTIVR